MQAKRATEYKSPQRKLLRFFEASRDKWKAKATGYREKLVLAGNQVRAVSKSRSTWKTRALAAERRVAELEEEVQKKECDPA